MATGNCQFLSVCYGDGTTVCVPKRVSSVLCEAVQSSVRRAPHRAPPAAAGTADGSVLFRMSAANSQQKAKLGSRSDDAAHVGSNIDVTAESLTSSSLASKSRTGSNTIWQRPQTSDGGDHDQSSARGVSSDTVPSWHQSCEQHRTRVHEVKELVKDVVALGPQVGHLMDLRTGARHSVTFWLRDDVRSLCIFDHNDTQVRVYSCSQMERCEDLGQAAEITARQFFLGLSIDDVARGLIITMERSAHSMAVTQQGHSGIIRKQLLLLCSSSKPKDALLGAIRALTAELVLKELGSDSQHTTFRQLSDWERSFRSNSCRLLSINRSGAQSERAQPRSGSETPKSSSVSKTYR